MLKFRYCKVLYHVMWNESIIILNVSINNKINNMIAFTVVELCCSWCEINILISQLMRPDNNNTLLHWFWCRIEFYHHHHRLISWHRYRQCVPESEEVFATAPLQPQIIIRHFVIVLFLMSELVIAIREHHPQRRQIHLMEGTRNEKTHMRCVLHLQGYKARITVA